MSEESGGRFRRPRAVGPARILRRAAGAPAADEVAMIYLRVDTAGAVRWANQPAMRLMERTRAGDATRANLVDLADHRERAGIEAALADTVANHRAEVVVRSAATADVDVRRYVHLLLSRDATAPGDGDATGPEIVVQGWDVSALVRRLQELEVHAHRDPLTGLANRMIFMDRLHHELARSARSGTDVAVLVAGLDGFDEVDDVHGHDVGDGVLVEVGHRLAASLRPGDTLARVARREFAVICADLAAPGQAMAVAGRLRASAAEPVTVHGRRRSMSLSVGVAFPSDHDGDDPGASLLRRAAEARCDGATWYAPLRAGPG